MNELNKIDPQKSAPDMSDSEKTRKRKRREIWIVIGILCAVFIAAILFLVSGFKENFDDEHITKFKADDIARAERIFDMTVTKDVELKDLFIEKLPPDAYNITLELETSDFDRFVTKNIRPPVELQKSEEQPYKYFYNNANVYVSITAKKLESGKYHVVLYKSKQ